MTEVLPKSTLYCGVCSYPPEYCEFTATFKRCKEWLLSNHQEVYEKLYSDEALANQTSTLSLEKEQKMEQELEKKQKKEEAKQERELQKKLSSKVTIKRIERNKRKHIISISGLEVFNIDMKKLSKTFASKFATGATVTKNAEKKEEILVQGDVSNEAKEYIEKLLEEKGLNEVKVEQIDDKKKKKALEAEAEAAAKAGKK
ncbi:density-regulated protein DRP1 [Suhomyces tanzawaensis NRRL Y-17324]|uniref:Translation machinery-associated protein 22 n=1 Tax=Suhomyces tanzawaensis NRRL Y-17324 TaxID=984487 RepID=A0A1E4SE01_9ASCO|nr:density-regulated protein DRP1 [Suhomyces tanzawaensis NRRL Y-17324]ODV77749.1 density-regulated protein DRP1 [Suhomyces tanzawaensis NRRL Y-17324]